MDISVEYLYKDYFEGYIKTLKIEDSFKASSTYIVTGYLTIKGKVDCLPGKRVRVRYYYL